MSRLIQLFSFLENNPADPFITYAIATEYASIAAYEKAIEWYIKTKEIDPNYLPLYYQLGLAYQKCNNKLRSIEILKAGKIVAAQLNDMKTLNEIDFLLEDVSDSF